MRSARLARCLYWMDAVPPSFPPRLFRVNSFVPFLTLSLHRIKYNKKKSRFKQPRCITYYKKIPFHINLSHKLNKLDCTFHTWRLTNLRMCMCTYGHWLLQIKPLSRATLAGRLLNKTFTLRRYARLSAPEVAAML